MQFNDITSDRYLELNSYFSTRTIGHLKAQDETPFDRGTKTGKGQTCLHVSEARKISEDKITNQCRRLIRVESNQRMEAKGNKFSLVDRLKSLKFKRKQKPCRAINEQISNLETKRDSLNQLQMAFSCNSNETSCPTPLNTPYHPNYTCNCDQEFSYPINETHPLTSHERLDKNIPPDKDDWSTIRTATSEMVCVRSFSRTQCQDATSL